MRVVFSVESKKKCIHCHKTVAYRHLFKMSLAVLSCNIFLRKTIEAIEKCCSSSILDEFMHKGAIRINSQPLQSV